MSTIKKKLNTLQKQYGGSGIPFSEFMKQKRKSKKKTTVRRKKTRSSSRKRKVTKRTKKRKAKSKSNKRCKCGNNTYNNNDNTPRGIGYCEECIPLNVIMKGKDGHLYENKNHQWIKFN